MAEQAEKTAPEQAVAEASEQAAPGNTKARGDRKVVQGIVTSTKMHKTITVESSVLKLHPKYKKFVKHYTKYKAHDEDEQAKDGDVVEIVMTRPLSKTKRYRLLRIVRSAHA